MQTLRAGTGECATSIYRGPTTWRPCLDGTGTSATRPTRTMGGQDTSYQQGVLQAMAQAGVEPHDPVLVV